MARTKKSETITTSVEETVNVEAPKVEKVKPIAKKKFEDRDLIPCRSITCGALIMSGGKTKNIYTWGNIGDEKGVEYQDLVYDVYSTNSFAKFPRFIVLDEDFIEKYGLKERYDELFKQGDLKDILLKVPVDQMIDVISKLPKGAQDSIKIMASTMIDNGQLDSVKRIQTLDNYFGTQMLLNLASN